MLNCSERDKTQKEPVYDRRMDISDVSSVTLIFGGDGKLTLKGGHDENARLVLLRQHTSLILHVPGYIEPDRFPAGRIFRNGYPAGDGDLMEEGEFLQAGDFFFYYRNQSLWSENREELTVCGLPYENLPERKDYPAFQRNTRILTPVDEEPIEILDPSSLPRRQEERIAVRLLPSLGMLAASGFMAARGGSAMLIFSGISAATGIFTAIAGVLSGGRRYRQALKEREQVYHRYIEEKQQEILHVRQIETGLRRKQYPAPQELLSLLDRFSPDLFDRSPADPDFLHLRLGIGTVRAGKKIHYKLREQIEERDYLQRIPEQTADRYQWIREVPVICDLKETAVIGIIGREEYRYGLLKNMVLDIALRQYYTDISIILISGEDHACRLHGFRMIPHISRSAGIPGSAESFQGALPFRGIAADKESRAAVFEYLYRELSERREQGSFRSHILVFFYNDDDFREHPVSRFLTCGKDLGVSFLFFAERREDLIQGCRKVIDIQSPGYAVIMDTRNSSEQSYFTFSGISDQQLKHAAAVTAPVYTREVSLNRALTRNFTLFEMLGIHTAQEIDIEKNWAAAAPERSLSAPVGIADQGILSVDISDSAHGPHGLMAGTTGSGKSELLQTYILSMAVRFSPDDVTFMIIDYKGGGLAGPFYSLPHLVGTITNMDGREAVRALRSVKGELLKRQKLFEKNGVNHIDRYMHLYKTKKVCDPLPHLIIIIDEFAELKAAHPDFMKELISAVRIGRSLGVHLILATQKPSGQVSDQIWSNSRFRICLKVQDASDSNEVLKSPVAAEIREPGRGYLQVGNREVFELFQSAYSSGPAAGGKEAGRGFDICEVSETGKRTLIWRRKDPAAGNTLTQMQAVISHIADYCRRKSVRKQPDIFQKPLEPVIPYQYTDGSPDSFPEARIGWYDDPDHQRRCSLTVDLSAQHVLITGSSRSGKTGLLQTLIRDLVLRYRPQEVQIYIIDCASRLLKSFGELPHIGGVVLSTEQEKMESLFRMLNKELEQRKLVLEQTGLPSIAAVRAAHRTELPEIVLVIDQLSALRELYFQEQDLLGPYCNEGLSAGIHVAAASSQASSVGYRYVSLFGERIALFSSDAGEYRYLFEHPAEQPDEIPGRCMIEREGSMFQSQVYLAFSGNTQEERLREISRFIREQSALHLFRARQIPMVPDLLTEEAMESCLEEGIPGLFHIPAGMQYREITPLWMDLAEPSVLYLSGKDGMGKHNWMAWMIRCLEKYFPDRYMVFAADGLEGRLGFIRNCSGAGNYTTDASETAEILCSIESVLRQRQEDVRQAKADPESWKLLLMLIDSPDAIDVMNTQERARDAFEQITGRYKRLKVRIIISCIENEPVSYSAPAPLRQLRERRNCLFFDDLDRCRLFELPYSTRSKKETPLKPGDAWYLSGADPVRIRVPLIRTPFQREPEL